MTNFAGKYQLEKNENLVRYLSDLGFPEDKAKKADEVRPQLQITVDGNKFTLTSNSGIRNSSSQFILNEEYDDPMPTGDVLKSFATLEGNKITILSKTKDGRSGVRIYEFLDDGFVLKLTSTTSAVVARRIYKRI